MNGTRSDRMKRKITSRETEKAKVASTGFRISPDVARSLEETRNVSAIRGRVARSQGKPAATPPRPERNASKP